VSLSLSAFARVGIAALALVALPAVASAQNRVVEIVNSTGVTMMEFYASNIGDSSSTYDILGADVLESGYSVDVDIDDGSGQCLFDFRAVFADGDEVIDEGVNVCEISVFTYE